VPQPKPKHKIFVRYSIGYIWIIILLKNVSLIKHKKISSDIDIISIFNQISNVVNLVHFKDIKINANAPIKTILPCNKT